MASTLTLFDPTAPRGDVQEAPGTATAALASLAGKVVGFIDNAKPNFDALVDDLGELLLNKYQISRVIKRRKSSASLPAEPQVISELAEACDLVITGSGD